MKLIGFTLIIPSLFVQVTQAGTASLEDVYVLFRTERWRCNRTVQTDSRSWLPQEFKLT